MCIIVIYSDFFACIRIAILAEMGTGVVLANIFALDATTELALTFVAVVAMSGISAIGKDDGIGGKWDGIAKEVGNGHGVDGDF